MSRLPSQESQGCQNQTIPKFQRRNLTGYFVAFAHSGVGASLVVFPERVLEADFFTGFILTLDFALGVDFAGI